MKTEEKHRNVHILHTRAKQEKLLLISDVHWDNPHCKRDLLKKHLEEAKIGGHKVLINGDLFCLMQGKYDPRRNKSEIRPEHNKANYLDLIIEDAAEWFKPYADVIELIGYGNHETSVLKNVETDMIQRFVERLNTISGSSKVHVGGYGGWAVVKFKKDDGKYSGGYDYKIKYHHGYGGGGPVTKGTIQHNRFSTYIQDADCIWMGHVHEDYEMTYSVEKLNKIYRPTQKNILMLRTPSYKEEYEDGSKGFHIERGRPVKPVGGRWLELDLKQKKGNYFVSGYSYKTKN